MALTALVTVPPLHVLLAEAGAVCHVAVGSVFQAACFEAATRLATPCLACQEESASQSSLPLVTSFLTLPRKSPVVCLTLLAPEEEAFDTRKNGLSVRTSKGCGCAPTFVLAQCILFVLCVSCVHCVSCIDHVVVIWSIIIALGHGRNENLANLPSCGPIVAHYSYKSSSWI